MVCAFMAQRFVEILLPRSCADRAREVLARNDHTELVAVEQGPDVRFELFVPTQGVEKLVDELQDVFPGAGDLRVVVQRVESGLPAEPEDEPDPLDAPDATLWTKSPRVSRDELKGVVFKGAQTTDTYLLLVLLSTIVALIGLVRSSPAIIIGAMVIAPLLGPNMALALSLTLGDGRIFARAMRTNVAGILLALALTLVFVPFLDPFPLNAELAARISIDWGDIGLALASGVAGALVLTIGEGMTLVGVMVAVALLPPLVTFAVCLGKGAWNEAVGALMLLVTNVLCINIAGVVTFLTRGYRPRDWWAAHQSAKRSRRALTVYLVVLAVVGLYIGAVQLGFLPDPRQVP